MSDFAQKACKGNTSPRSVKNGHPVSPGDTQQNEMEIADTEFHGRDPSDRALELLECREIGDVWGRDTSDLRSSFKEEIAAGE